MKRTLWLSLILLTVACGDGTDAMITEDIETPETDDEETVEVGQEDLLLLMDAAKEQADQQGNIIEDDEETAFREATAEATVAPMKIAPAFLEEVIPGHNKVDAAGRENIIFVGHGNRTKAYFKIAAEDIVDLEGKGLPTAAYRNGRLETRMVYGLFGQDVFLDEDHKFNFWYLDLKTAGVSFKRTSHSLCSQEMKFSELENKLLPSLRFQYKTFVHLLSDTNCRSQATWFTVPSGLYVDQIIKNAVNWTKLNNYLTDVWRGRLTLAQALQNSVNWNTVHAVTFRPDAYPRVFLNIRDLNRQAPTPEFVEVAVHEFGHAFGRFWDEYADSTISDVVDMDGFRRTLDVNVNLISIFPATVVKLLRLREVRINPFQFILKNFDFMGPNCAATPEMARERWGNDYAGYGEGSLQITTTTGCFYYSNYFYRSSADSKMRTSATPFNAFQEDYLLENFLGRRWDNEMKSRIQ